MHRTGCIHRFSVETYSAGLLLHYFLSCVILWFSMATVTTNEATGKMGQLLAAHQDMVELPAVGEIIAGSIIDKGRNAMYIDLGPLGVGVIYGRDLFDDMDTFQTANLGDPVEATVVRYDNEESLIELSLQSATRERSWTELRRKMETGDVFETEVIDANKGGLLVRVNGVTGFLPVSQLAPDHYPRVEGGDKHKIFERLKELVGTPLNVKVLTADQDNEKLIVSEKAAVSDELSAALENVNVGDVVDGTVSGIVDFGVFVKFVLEGKELEGLVHISELAWQRVDKVDDFVSVGDPVQAKVIGVDGLRISLSMKQLQDDPWMSVAEKYTIGERVKGEVLKVTPFGGFIKLDNDIHGLVHVSELPDEVQSDPTKLLEAGKKKFFTIISIEPKNHRLGLSLRKDAGMTKGAVESRETTEAQKGVVGDTPEPPSGPTT